MHGKLFVFLFVCLFLGSMLGMASANIYMDEDFEGATAFNNHGGAWVIAAADTTSSPTAATVGVKGINLRAYKDATYDYTKPAVGMTADGAITTNRKFLGTKAYELLTGKSIKITPGEFPTRDGGELQFVQFAISVGDDAFAKPAGTVIGHFQSDWTITSTSSIEPEASLTLQLKKNATGGVDLVCANNSAILGNITSAKGSWFLVSMIENIRVKANDAANLFGKSVWVAWDPLASKWKGPVPTNPAPYGNSYVANTDAPQLSTGISIFVNSKTAASLVVPGAGWGNNNNGDVPNNLDTSCISWEVVADAGSVYVDNMNWNVSVSAVTAAGQEAAARMLDFDVSTVEKGEAAASTWDLY